MKALQCNNVLNPFNKFRGLTASKPICSVQDLQIKTSKIKEKDGSTDTFTKSLPKLEPELFPLENHETYQSLKQTLSEIHKKRMELYGTKNEEKQPRNVSKAEFNAMKLIQYEMSEYTSTQKKLRSGEELSPKEEKFCEEIIKGLKRTEEERSVWRSVNPYPGFIDSINNGELNLLGFTSTSSEYTDFFDFWESAEIKMINEKRYAKLPYMLKINIPVGTPILDCNATYKGKRTRMADEVVLLPSHCKVKNIDIENRIIELDYNK